MEKVVKAQSHSELQGGLRCIKQYVTLMIRLGTLSVENDKVCAVKEKAIRWKDIILVVVDRLTKIRLYWFPSITTANQPQTVVNSWLEIFLPFRQVLTWSNGLPAFLGQNSASF